MILSPGSEYGKQFTAKEIEAMLDGTLGSPTDRMETQNEIQIMIGEPANPPTEPSATTPRHQYFGDG